MGERKTVAGLLIVVSILVLLAGVSAARQDQSTSGTTSQSTSGSKKDRSTSGDMKHKDHSMNGDMKQKDQSMSGAATAKSPDMKFVMKAAMGGMMEVELGRLATERANSDEVKQFGQRMVDDHSKANDELMQLASSKGITLSTSMDAKQQAMKDKLSKLSGEEFDRAYMSSMVKDHKKDVAEFQREAGAGKDQEVKAFAAKTLPTLQEHLRMAQDINTKEHSKEHREGSMEGNKKQKS